MQGLLAILLFYYSQFALGNTSPEIIKDYIATEALVAGVNPQLAIQIAHDESKFNPMAIGDHGESYGIWQIHLPAHVSLNAQNAQDIVFSTQWSVNQLKEGNCRIWSTCPIK